MAWSSLARISFAPVRLVRRRSALSVLPAQDGRFRDRDLESLCDRQGVAAVVQRGQTVRNETIAVPALSAAPAPADQQPPSSSTTEKPRRRDQ
jgi:hypothetical protein